MWVNLARFAPSSSKTVRAACEPQAAQASVVNTVNTPV